MFPHLKLDWTLSRLEKKAEAQPDDPATRAELAVACLSKAWFHDGGEIWFNRALTAARRLLQQDPQNTTGLVVTGASLVGMQRPDHAQQYLDEALRQEPERADLRLALGAWCRQRGDRHGALRELESAARLAPGSWEAHALLGRTLWERAGELSHPPRLVERAQYHFVRALQLEPTPAWKLETGYLLAIACLHAERYEWAERLLRELLPDARWRSRSQYYLGLVAYQTGKYENAVNYLRQHLNSSGETARVHGRIGMCYLQLGQLAKAREACNRALALDPNDVQARHTLGATLLAEGHPDEAQRLLREILAEDPGHLPSFTELVRIRTTARDRRWLRGALRAEVNGYDRLAPHAAPRGEGGAELVGPRQATRARIRVLLRALGELDPDPSATLEALDLTTDEGLRAEIWEATVGAAAQRRAKEVQARLAEPGRCFSVALGRELLTLADRLPEEVLRRALDLDEDDLRRAAVDRHGAANDVLAHRRAIDEERREARTWQALLLLALAAHDTTSARGLLLRWSNEADADLADAACGALALLGDSEGLERLRRRARNVGATNLVDALARSVVPPRAREPFRMVEGEADRLCTACGRRGDQVHHLVVGTDVALCDRCTTEVARGRRELETQDPTVRCRFTGHTCIDVRAVYVLRGLPLSIEVLEQSLGLMEREEVERFLSA